MIIRQAEKIRTLKTFTWQLDEWTCSMYSPCSLVVKVSTWIRKGTPFSPPCFLGVNSVLMQLTWEDMMGEGLTAESLSQLSPPQVSTCTWMKTEAFLTGSQRNSMVLRCRGCEQGSSIPADNGISAHNQSVSLHLLEIFSQLASGFDWWGF